MSRTWIAAVAAAVSMGGLQAQQQPEIGVRGYVLTPDSVPVTAGSVEIRGQPPAAIGSDGRFQIVPHDSGLYDFRIDVPGHAPHRLAVIVPASRRLLLPPIRLSPPTYFRARFVTPTGQGIRSPRVMLQSMPTIGMPVLVPAPSPLQEEVADDGTVTIGPLPRGILRMTLESPPHASMRLPDISVSGASPLIDGGTITVYPGARLDVEVVDGAGAPVPGHDVMLTDAAPLSPIALQPMATDQLGRVSFDRLAPGRYRLQTRSVERCNGRYLLISRDVSVPASGSRSTQLVVGGTASVRLTSAGAPRAGITVAAAPSDQDAQQQQPFWLRGPFGAPCIGLTDENGRATFPNFPPGRARIDVRLPNSSLIRRVTVPARVRDVPIEIPSGYLPLRVSNERTRDPIGGAMVAWFSTGFRIEATTSATGEVLLDGIAPAGGTLRVDARGFETRQVKLPEAPATLYEVPLVQTRDASIECRVVNESGEPISDAVVELIPQDPLTTVQVTTTNAQGVAGFPSSPRGTLRFIVRADTYAASGVNVSAEARDAIVTLARGFRVAVRAEAIDAAHRVELVDGTGASMEHALDALSDRIVGSAGVVSLGPLMPGSYLVKLRGATGERLARVQLQDRDAAVTIK